MNIEHANDNRDLHGQRDYQRYDPDPSNNLLSEQSSDERLQHDASAALKQYGILNADAIAVQVHEGVVTLTGEISSRHARRVAEECVQRLAGVEGVSNRLRLGYKYENDDLPSLSPLSNGSPQNASKFSKRRDPSAHTPR